MFGLWGDFAYEVLVTFTREKVIPELKKQLPEIANLDMTNVCTPELWERWLVESTRKAGPMIDVLRVQTGENL